MTSSQKISFQISRLLIAVVVFLNLQAAVLFLVHPAEFAPGFELSGIPGKAAVQGIGLLFIMWNVPYAAALIDPVRYRVSLIEAICMQTIGVVGEIILWQLLPFGHALIVSSVSRFALFDGFDLVLLILAWLFTRRLRQ